MDLVCLPQFKQFFRQAASLDIDKEDLRRFYDFVGDRTYKLLVPAEATAKANGRDLIEPHDLPITKGLQECEETKERLPQVSGGLVSPWRAASASSTTRLKPQTTHWDKAEQVSGLLL
ncbi:DUF1931 family protein [Arthrobacter globiformis]|uniref:Uncharacterized protein n=1 Tax=Arthrobacter globiformis TaxID=1665 RepID=A0A328HE44_ARTGO|nr:DUF1931 family protein [Arthrobacter globiformis]RAM35665.1 hypothetical protein DBZ45_18710 [Arthrobacter globiformis]